MASVVASSPWLGGSAAIVALAVPPSEPTNASVGTGGDSGGGGSDGASDDSDGEDLVLPTSGLPTNAAHAARAQARERARAAAVAAAAGAAPEASLPAGRSAEEADPVRLGARAFASVVGG